MNNSINPLNTFRHNINSVEKLINFDQEVQDIAISAIEELHDDLVNIHNITNPQQNGDRTLTILRGVRTNDALKLKYKTVYNQAVVLLVSYFGSMLSDLFRYSAKIAVLTHKDKRVLNEELKLQVYELLNIRKDIGDTIGDILIEKKDMSFQDMKSVSRLFKNYFGIDIDKDNLVNNIILGHACRHSIVHEGGIVNSRVINQVREAKPRDLKENVNLEKDISFSVPEIRILSNSMLKYAENLMEKITEYEKGNI